MKKYLVALDQGTTSSRAIVFDRSQQIVASAQKEFPSSTRRRAGWSTIRSNYTPASTAS